jgi:prolyl-tRNA editing enzyme YbaK/EbsC (Cys-tRNA(Pro) deacylase)
VLAGAVLDKADATSVRSVTGFAIGGVAPLGHLTPIDAWLDPRLLDFPTVWAAAGTPHHVFPVGPSVLAKAVGATVADFCA